MLRGNSRFVIVVVGIMLLASAGLAQDPPINFIGNLDSATGEIVLSWEEPEDALSYVVYRDDAQIGTPTERYYVDALTEAGAFDYTVTAMYDGDIESDPAGPVNADWDGILGVPENLNAAWYTVCPESLSIFWDHFVGDEELIFDTDESTQGITYLNDSHAPFAMQITPAGPCRLLRLEYKCFYNPEDALEEDYYPFDAEVYEWDDHDGEPGTTALYSEEHEILNGYWFGVDVSAQNLVFEADFVICYGSHFSAIYLYYEEAEDLHRGWADLGQGWIPFVFNNADQNFYIRAVVQYLETQEIAVLGSGEGDETGELDELDDFVGFHLFLEDIEISPEPLQSNFMRFTLPEYGTYNFTVSAEYASGESELTEPMTITYAPEIEAPFNLVADLNDATGEVTLTWEHPLLDGAMAGVAGGINSVTIVEETADPATGFGSARVIQNQAGGISELDDFIQFKIIRNSGVIDSTSEGTYTDLLTEGGMYGYVVYAEYDEGDSENSNFVLINWTSVDEKIYPGIPEQFAIESAYPNPFNPSVSIILAVPQAGIVGAEVFDLLGRRVATLSSGRLEAGYHQMTWRAENLPAGIYFLKMTSSMGVEEIRKLMLLK